MEGESRREGALKRGGERGRGTTAEEEVEKGVGEDATGESGEGL